jgi:large subunit ribosomal protein L3
MPHAIIGKKYCMSRVFQEDGTDVPVTLIRCNDNIVVDRKTIEKNGYNSIVVSTDKYKKSSKTKKYGITKEFILGENNNEEFKKGDQLNLSDFENVDTVSIYSYSKGKGFQGVIKRHNFSRGPKTHGSDHHRAPGSIGACEEPGKVFKGKKLPGRMGNKKISLKGIKVVNIDKSNNIIALKGPIPGSKNSIVKIIVEKLKS